jgi:hypothetical protein
MLNYECVDSGCYKREGKVVYERDKEGKRDKCHKKERERERERQRERKKERERERERERESVVDFTLWPSILRRVAQKCPFTVIYFSTLLF